MAVKTGDEETSAAGKEEHEESEAEALGAFIATSLAELIDERGQVQDLIALAETVHNSGQESKFERMAELLRAPQYRDQKIIIYTEHRDTLEFLRRRLDGMGYADQVAYIHGGLGFEERDAQVERFRKPHDTESKGARFFIGTDAAAEGINLQFCWILINYDVPWNPARLEQRMGRIHRYGQKRDRVAIINLVAGKTREGRVIKTLLDKLEEIRNQLGSDKVFDVVGRIFEGMSITDYIQRAVESDDEADKKALELAGQLTPEQIKAIEVREQTIYGKGGEVLTDLPQLRDAMAIEEMRRLLPGYVRRYLEHAAPVIGVDFIGDLDNQFFMRPRQRGVLESLLPLLENYPESARNRFTVYRPDDGRDAIFIHPGEPVFERLSAIAIEHSRSAGLRGAIFTDVSATAPYLFHVARVTIVRGIDPGIPSFNAVDVIEQRLSDDVPPGFVNESAQLFFPPPPVLSVDILPVQLAAAWQGDESNAHLIHAALSSKAGKPLPWSRVAHALDEAFRLGLIERTLDSGAWPCDLGGASAVKVRVRKSEAKQPPPGKHYGSKVASAELQTHEVQDLADNIDALREATAGQPLRIRVTLEIGEEGHVDQAVVDKVNGILGQIKAGWKAE